MIRSLRAFAWLRWKLLRNGLRGKRRDAVERLSRAAALLAPALLVVPFAVGGTVLGALGFLGGREAGSGSAEPAPILFVARILLLLVLLLPILVPLGRATHGSTAGYARLLLLPIPRRALHLAEVGAGLVDPWLAFVVPGLVLLAAGILAAGRPAAALLALCAGLAFLAVVASLGALVSFAADLVMRNRRRGEVVTLLFVLALSLVAIVPMLFAERFEDRVRERKMARREQLAPSQGDPTQDPPAAAEGKPGEDPLVPAGGKTGDDPPAVAERNPGEDPLASAGRKPKLALLFSVDELDASLPAWTRAIPSELYSRSIQRGLEGRTGEAGLLLGALLAEALALFGLSSVAHRKVLETTEGGGSRRRAAQVAEPAPRLPFLSHAASAVAAAQTRNAFRSVRGRLSILLPGPLLAMLGWLSRRMPEEVPLGSLLSSEGHLVLAFGIVFSLYSLQAFHLNQFASDRAGLSLQLLAPIRDGDLVRGKAAGGAVILAAAVALCLVCSLIVAPGGSPLAWLSVLLAGAATYALLAPMAALLSAVFPVASDLSKTGSGGNPHFLCVLVGMFSTMACAGPPGLVLAIVDQRLERPGLALALVAAWTAVAIVVSILLVGPVARVVGRRRENLALVAQGR